MKQYLMYVIFAVVIVVLFLIGLRLVVEMPWLVWAFPLAVSFGGMTLLRWSLEDNQPHGMFNGQTQSWAYMIGDGLFLPIAFVAVSIGWRQLQPDRFDSVHAASICLLIGLVLGLGFHMMDGTYYQMNGGEFALSGPSKIYHDFVVYPVLAGVLLWGGVPLLMDATWNKWTIVAVLALAGWGLMGALDAKRGLVPADLHPDWDQRQFIVINSS